MKKLDKDDLATFDYNEEVQQRAEDKWNMVQRSLKQLEDSVSLPCSYCLFYARCEVCPMFQNITRGVHCDDYFDIVDKIEHIHLSVKKIRNRLKGVRKANE